MSSQTLKTRSRSLTNLLALLFLLVLPGRILAQSTAEKKLQANGTKSQPSKFGEVDLPETQRRSFAISLVTSLAEEARSYQDEALRARVLARAADIVWDADNHAGRLLFRRAWEAAEKGDADKQASLNNWQHWRRGFWSFGGLSVACKRRFVSLGGAGKELHQRSSPSHCDTGNRKPSFRAVGIG